MNIIEIIKDLHPVMQAFLAACFAWLGTSVGAFGVFIKKEINRKTLDGMLGFAAGVMIAASFWSLLAPSLEMSAEKNIPEWFPALTGFILGGAFLRIIDQILPHLHSGFKTEEAEGLKTSWRRTTLLVLAVALHNIPEGLAVGVAFGAAGAGAPAASVAGAVALAVGIALHNIPEGAAVSFALRREGVGRFKSFWYGQLSGIIELTACILGVVAVMAIEPILPYALGFAAGAMIFVVIEDIIPESQRSGNTDIATLGSMLGFALMMVLATGLG